MRTSPGSIAVALVSLVTSAVAGPKDPVPARVDPAPLRADLLVLQEPGGGLVVVYKGGTNEARVWYGTGKTLYEQRLVGRGRDGDAWNHVAWTPRLPSVQMGSIDFRKDGRYVRFCSDADRPELTRLEGDAADAALAKVQLLTQALVRRPHLLARDDRGTYYYVDRLAQAHGGKGFRVFAGKRGAMKQMPLVDVASDSAGDVFATKRGELRLVRTSTSLETSATWIRGRAKTALVTLDVDGNSPLIFNELGIYRFIGTICDR